MFVCCDTSNVRAVLEDKKIVSDMLGSCIMVSSLFLSIVVVTGFSIAFDRAAAVHAV